MTSPLGLAVASVVSDVAEPAEEPDLAGSGGDAASQVHAAEAAKAISMRAVAGEHENRNDNVNGTS